MTVRSGDLRQRLVLEQPVAAPDGAGGFIVTWTPVATVWAALAPLSAGELAFADGLKGRVTHRIVLRRRQGVSADRRFRDGARIFDIRSVIDLGERHVWLECLAEETTR